MDQVSTSAAATTAGAETAPTSVPAVDAAIASGSTRDFRAARRAERAGKPLADVPVKTESAETTPATEKAITEPATAAAPETRKTREQKEAERVAARIKEGIETARATDAARIKALEDQLATRSTETARPADDSKTPPAAVAAEKKTPDYKRIMALPGAPKLADFESIEEHSFAAAEFVREVRDNERAAADRDRAGRDAQTAAERAANEAFGTQLEAAKKADPAFISKLSAEVKALTPIAWFPRDAQGRYVDAQGKPVTFGPEHAIATFVHQSPHVAALLLHFSEHPEALKTLQAMPPAIAAMADRSAQRRVHYAHMQREFHRLEGRLAAAASTSATASTEEVEDEPKTISDAPEPAVTLGSRPVEPGDAKDKAIKRGDTRSYRQIRRSERAAQLGLRR
jgi:hypothetical protein